MAFMDGELNLIRRKAVEEHLKTCPECRAMMESLELAESEVAKAEKVEAPDGYFTSFASRVANRIAGRELATARRPWILRWGWMPAAAAAAFAAVMVLSHGFYDQPLVRQVNLERKVIPIPIAPEPRAPETAAVLKSYYEEAPVAPATGIEPSERDRTAASGAARPAPPVSSEVAEISANEVSAVTRTRAISSTGLVEMAGSPASPPSAADVSDAKAKRAAADELRSAEPALEIADKTQPQEPATSPGDMDEVMAKKEDEHLSEANRKGDATGRLLPPRGRLVRIRQVGGSRVLLPVEPAPDSCPEPEVAAVEAIVIHLPNGGETQPPEVEPALRICLPQ